MYRRRIRARTTKAVQPTRGKYSMSKWRASPTLGLSMPQSTPISRRLRTNLTYFENRIAIDPTLGGIAADRVFRLNSLYDPDLTGVGHQPAGFDQLMTLYKYYAVVAASAHVTFQNTDTSNEAICITNVSNTNASITDVQPVIENGRCNYMLLSAAGRSRDVIDMKCAVNVLEEVGGRNVLDNQDLWGQAGSDPTNQLYLHVAAQPNSTTNMGPIGLVVVIEYDVIFFQPNTIPSS